MLRPPAASDSLFIYTESVLYKDSDSNYYSISYDADILKRYSGSYVQIFLVCRCRAKQDSLDLPRLKFDSCNCTVVEIPGYSGLIQYILSLHSIISQINKLVFAYRGASHLLRMPGLIGLLAAFVLFLRRTQYGVELVGDINEVITHEKLFGVFSGLAANISLKIIGSICRNASAISYVSSSKLMQKYPPSAQAFVTSYSSIVLDENHYSKAKAIINGDRNYAFQLLAVGSMERMYKGFDILVKALHLSLADIPNVRLSVVGEGKHKRDLQQLVNQYRLHRSVIFVGQLSRYEVFRLMDRSDLFVLSSRTEGLARVLIEASARRLPSIASDVGASADLLPPEAIYTPNNPASLSRQLVSTLLDCRLRSYISDYAFSRSRNYSSASISSSVEELCKHMKSGFFSSLR